jgi:hypothetical protein
VCDARLVIDHGCLAEATGNIEVWTSTLAVSRLDGHRES